MACSLPHTIDEIKALVEKLIDKDIVRQKAITELAMQFDNANTTKDDLRLRTEQEKELTLVNNLLGEMTRYLLQKRSHAEEEMRVCLLPLDQPLNSYGLHTMRMSSKSDTRMSNIFEAAREEMIRSMDERKELNNNYRAI
ncbi:hypothetical protein Tco_1465113 [Tanacetum coccineum]